MNKISKYINVISVSFLGCCTPAWPEEGGEYERLVKLFHDWRAFEQPPIIGGVPDYTASTTAARHVRLKAFQARLNGFDIGTWPVEQIIDWRLLKAEMNGMDFNIRILRPWARDPAFYTSIWTFQSDTPDHEGPNHHAIIELWQHSFPLDDLAEARLAMELRTIPPLLEQARGNLTGNARELWIGGIMNLEQQQRVLTELTANTAESGPELRQVIEDARQATEGFILWLRDQSYNKTGPSGIGIDNYTWYLQNVHLVPMSWEDEVRLLKRELARALSSLKLEEHRNRDLPPSVPIATEVEWAERTEAAVIRFRDFLKDQRILPPYDYIESALRSHTGSFVPEIERNFFWTVAHHDPLVLWAHWYHWFDLARMESDSHPSPIRRGALLYNIWDSRAEGMATAFEEIVMRAGLFDDTPRSRELVWIMLAQRAARGLGSLYAQANMIDLKAARDFHVKWTPRGWMREDLDLLGFEQLLYLRQPGYGTSYVTGKYLIEQLMGEVGAELDEDFALNAFFEEFDRAGVIPVSMIRWQMTGRPSEMLGTITVSSSMDNLRGGK